MIGDAGLTDAVMREIEVALKGHELIKVRVLETSPIDRRECEAALATATHSHGVGTIGRMVMLYRRHPEKPKITLPKK